ncbi:MAG: hypothetical protein AB7Q00_14685 [Phycisphaerales bacterium]
MADINRMFSNGKTYATYGNAERKVKAFDDALADSYTGAMLDEVRASFHTVIIQHGARYQIVAFMRYECRIPVVAFINAGMCVTN